MHLLLALGPELSQKQLGLNKSLNRLLWRARSSSRSLTIFHTLMMVLRALTWRRLLMLLELLHKLMFHVVDRVVLLHRFRRASLLLAWLLLFLLSRLIGGRTC